MYRLTSEEYVQQVDRFMNLQNLYLGIFLGILAIVVAIFGVFQWRLSDEQVEKIKNETEKKLLDQFNIKLEESRENNKQIVLNSTRYPLFQTIDLILMTDIRIDSLPRKIEQILHSLENISEIYDYEFSILRKALTYFVQKNEKVMTENKNNYIDNYLSIEYIFSFVEKRLSEEQKMTGAYRKLIDDRKKFKDKNNELFEGYMSGIRE